MISVIPGDGEFLNWRIAVLLTCHNRRQKTLRSLDCLHRQDLPAGWSFTTYLVDDGSTDGTATAVREAFPGVEVIQGNGSLFWCGGMRLAWARAAVARAHDGYLWLNDDTYLAPGAFTTFRVALQAAWQHTGKHAVVVGAVQDPRTGVTAYGACTGHQARPPGGTPSPFQGKERMTGNVVLVPESVRLRLGQMSEAFTHAMGDTEYGIRVQRAGVPLWLTGSHVGQCIKDPPRSGWCDPEIPLRDRWRILHSPHGCPPREYAHIARLIRGPLWPLVLLRIYLRVLFPRALARKPV